VAAAALSCWATQKAAATISPAMAQAVTIVRAQPDSTKFNQQAALPYELRLADFELAMQDLYDLLFDINTAMVLRGLQRLEETVRPAIFSGILSDALTASVARHSRVLTENRFHNGHPDLILQGRYKRCGQGR
jgi:hypothetical protein